MSTRLVITPWDGKNIHFLDRCKLSVKESGIDHVVVRCGKNWESVIFSMRNDADGIAWVDADDIVYPGALIHSFEMLENNKTGLVYTNECRIDINDNQLSMSSTGQKTLWDLASHPSCVHHLVVTKKDTITDRVLDIYNRTQVPLDWAMKVDSGSRFGIKHVPVLGYGWRVHSTQITASKSLDFQLRRTMQEIRNEFREWVSGVKQS